MFTICLLGDIIRWWKESEWNINVYSINYQCITLGTHLTYLGLILARVEYLSSMMGRIK